MHSVAFFIMISKMLQLLLLIKIGWLVLEWPLGKHLDDLCMVKHLDGLWLIDTNKQLSKQISNPA